MPSTSHQCGHGYNTRMRMPLWLKIGWTVWLLVWAPVFWRHYGAQNFLYFCDLGNLLIGVALWLESPLFFSWAATWLLLFQTLYLIDLAGALLDGRHLIGGTEYMFDASLPLWLRLLSLFHAVTPPLLLWGIRRLGYDSRGWLLAMLITWVVVPINYFWRPQFDVNWARGPHGHEQHLVAGWIYLLGYLIVIPLIVYWPTHWLLRRWGPKSNRHRTIKHRLGISVSVDRDRYWCRKRPPPLA